MKLAMLLGLLAFTLQQSNAQSFDVASIKPSPPDVNSSQTTWDPGRMLGRGVSLKQLIVWAYEVTDIAALAAARPDTPIWMNRASDRDPAALVGSITPTAA